MKTKLFNNKRLFFYLIYSSLFLSLTSSLVISCFSKPDEINWLEVNSQWAKNLYFKDTKKINYELVEKIQQQLNFNDLKKAYPQLNQFNNFVDYYEYMYSLLKQDFNFLKNKISSQLYDKSALVLENQKIIADNHEYYNYFHILLPTYSSFLYDQQKDAISFQFAFPYPKSKRLSQIIDYHSTIGHISNYSNFTQTNQIIEQSFTKNVDYVFYLYDPKFKPKEFDLNSLHSKNDFIASKLLKDQNKQVIFIDRHLYHLASNSILAQFVLILEIAKAMKIDYRKEDLAFWKAIIKQPKKSIEIFNKKILTASNEGVDVLVLFGILPDIIIDYNRIADLKYNDKGLAFYLGKLVQKANSLQLNKLINISNGYIFYQINPELMIVDKFEQYHVKRVIKGLNLKSKLITSSSGSNKKYHIFANLSFIK